MRSEDLCWGCSGGQGNDHLHHRSEGWPRVNLNKFFTIEINQLLVDKEPHYERI